MWALLVHALCRWDDAVRVADASRHASTDELKRAHYQWLLQTGQEDKAGSAKEREGDLLGAIGLYMKGGLPARAAQVRACQGTRKQGTWHLALPPTDALALACCYVCTLVYRGQTTTTIPCFCCVVCCS